MSSENIDISQLADTIVKEMQNYSEKINKAVEKAVNQTAKETAAELRKTSPVRSSPKPRKYSSSGKSYPAGSYAKSWGIANPSEEQKGVISKVVRNKSHYRLTHLLENGHQSRNGGNVRARVHIQPAEEKAADILEKRIEEALKNGTQ